MECFPDDGCMLPDWFIIVMSLVPYLYMAFKLILVFGLIRTVYLVNKLLQKKLGSY